MLLGIWAISPQFPGVGNQSIDVIATARVNAIENKIAAPAILSKVLTFITNSIYVRLTILDGKCSTC